MSNIYLKVTIEEKNWRSQNFNFLGLKTLSPCQFWGSPAHKCIIIFKALIPGGNKKPSAAGLFKYAWLFCYHQTLKG